MANDIAADIAAIRALNRTAIERATAMLATSPKLDTNPDSIVPGHPLADRFGVEAARDMVYPPSMRRADRATKLRADVERLSLAGKLVREIVAELGVSYRYVVQLRGELGVGRRR